MDPARRLRFVIAGVVALLLVAVVPWPVGDRRGRPGPARGRGGRPRGDVGTGPGHRRARRRAGGPRPAAWRGSTRGARARLAALRAEAERALYAGAAAGERGDAVARRIADLERQEALARLSSADRADRRTHLTSPIDGVVLTAGLAELEGTWLEAGDVFCQVSTLDTLRVEIGISEADIGRVQPGQPIRLKVLAFPDRQFRGRVTEVAYQGEETQPGRPTAFKVIGRVANPGPHSRAE